MPQLIEHLAELTRKALCHVKEHGRNAVALFEDLVKEGFMVESDITGEVELF
jgi:hypothetical protein